LEELVFMQGVIRMMVHLRYRMRAREEHKAAPVTKKAEEESWGRNVKVCHDK
jgi:hypothetical protein